MMSCICVCVSCVFDLVLGGDLRRARHRPDRHIPRGLRPPTREDQRVLQ